MTNMPQKQPQQMKQLNKTENIIFLLGAILMVIGSAAYVFAQTWAPWIYAMGALAFVLMQLKQGYEGDNIVIRRLRNITVFSDFCFLLSAVLMFANMDNMFGLPFMFYAQYIHNNWVIALLVAAILQLYSTHRISHELDKDAKNTKSDNISFK